MSIPELMGQVLFLSGMALLGILISRLLRLELTLSCVLAGVLTGLALPLLGFDTGIRASNLHDLVFFVMLPVLIFEAAWKTEPAMLKRWLGPLMMLSTFGVLISCSVVAIGLYYAIDHPAGFPWIAAVLTGAILAATDPISVSAKLETLNAPEDLKTLFEGESLFNDATTVVLYGLVVAVATNAQAVGVSDSLANFLMVFFGGIFLGAGMGLLAAIVILLNASLSMGRAAGSMVLVLLTFSSFYVAEHSLHVSGIMAVTAAALTARFCLREHETSVLAGATETWQWLGLYFVSLIFALLGLVVSWDMFIHQWVAILYAIAACLLGRTLAVWLCGLGSRGFTYPICSQWQPLLIWGGLKGPIAIVLVLSLPGSLPYWWTIQSMVFGVVLFSLLIQGTTTTPLIRRSL